MHAASNPTAETITRASKSNLALSFLSLRGDRRRDITTFYAFCRIVDDIADSPTLPAAEKRAQLDTWKRSIDSSVSNEPPLAAPTREVIARYRIPREHFHEIIAGVGMDVEPAGYETWDDLRLYCYRVASAVGLVSIEIFGYRNPACREYAVNLGLALQLTNILRDVGQDFTNGGRVYLPRAELTKFGYSISDLERGARDERFLALMDFQATRARSLYAHAEEVLPREDRRSMVAAEIMRRVYRRLLERMERDRFHVFEKRYTLSGVEKAMAIVMSML